MVGMRSILSRIMRRLSGLFLVSGLFASGTVAAFSAPERVSKDDLTPLTRINTKSFAPASVRVFWDTSYSQEAYEAQALSFLTALIDEVRPFSLELVPFGAEARPDDRIDMRAEADELDYFVRQLGYSGESDISALYRAETDRPARDVCFLVTDGRSTPARLPVRQLPCQVHVISASPEADTGALDRLARHGGGQHIDLAALNFSEARKRLS